MISVLLRLLAPVILFAGLAGTLSYPAAALVPATSDSPDAAPAVEQAIAQDRDRDSDARIAERLRGIFTELPAFEGVDVQVSEGVVSLTGTVSDSETINRAENIAGRVQGVVTVENAIERDVSVEANLSVFGKISEIARGFVEILPLLVVALVTAAAMGALGYVIASPAAFWNRIATNAFLGELIRSAIRFAFVVGGLVVGLDMLGAGTLLGAVLGGAGVVGLALGFAMRDTVENYVASLMLSLRQPFRANDHIVIDDKEGRVIRLTSRATILMTLDGNHLRIPNSQVFKAVILNYTRNPQRRFDFELGIDADDDPRAAMALGREVLSGLSFVLVEPEPAARINQVGDSNIVIQFLGWIDQTEADWFKSRSQAIAAVKEALEDAGFALPEPIYRLRFDSRTDPLPLGGSAQITEAKQAQPAKEADTPAVRPKPPIAPESDVRPESEIAAMVEEERKGEGGQAEDLLDHSRPVE